MTEKQSKGIVHQTKVCKFCGHDYIKPCDEKQAKSCPNVKIKLKGKKNG